MNLGVTSQVVCSGGPIKNQVTIEMPIWMRGTTKKGDKISWLKEGKLKGGREEPIFPKKLEQEVTMQDAVIGPTAIWLPYGQLWAIIKGAAHSPNVNHSIFTCLTQRSLGTL